MKRICFVVVLLAAGIVSAAEKKAVVYVDKFKPGISSKLTSGGIDELQTRIIGNVVSSRKYQVVEREDLAKVQKELKLVDAGMTEGEAPESNRLQAAGYIVYGEILQCHGYSKSAVMGDGVSVECYYGTVELRIKISNITSGRILAAKTIKVEKKRSKTDIAGVSNGLDHKRMLMIEAITDAAKEVVFKLNDVAFPVYVISANARTVTGNITEEQVTPGEVWEVNLLGDELTDPQTGENLGYDEEIIAKVRVSRPGPKTTKFEYCSDEDKKAVLGAKEDGEKMLLRRAPEVLRQEGSKNSPKKQLPLEAF